MAEAAGVGALLAQLIVLLEYLASLSSVSKITKSKVNDEE